MDGSVETLLVILISLISVLTIASLAAIIALLVAVNKLISKLKLMSDTASETLVEVRQKIAKPAGLFMAARYVYKLIKR